MKLKSYITQFSRHRVGRGNAQSKTRGVSDTKRSKHWLFIAGASVMLGISAPESTSPLGPG